jgi:hypothetical protein
MHNDNPEMISIPINEYEALKHYKKLWEFYCGNADFEVEDGTFNEDTDEYTADPEGEVIIYTNKTLREENDFFNTLPANDEECGEADMSCEGCGECRGCCGEDHSGAVVNVDFAPIKEGEEDD